MAKADQQITGIVQRLQTAHQNLVEQALEDYFGSMPEERFPRRDELESAEQRARVCLRRGLWAPEWLAHLTDGGDMPEDRREALKLAFISQTHPFRAPLPTGAEEVPPRMLGYAAAIGALIGLLLATLLQRLLTGGVHLDLGLLLAAPTGAFAMVVAMGWLSRHGRIRRMLQGALGVAGVVELWMAVSGTVNPLHGIWRRLTKRHPTWSMIRRVLTYIAIILLLQLSRRRPTYYRADHEEAMRQAVDQWLAGAERLQAAMYVCSEFASPGFAGNEQIECLARQLYSIHASTMEELPISASELLQEARNAGFERLEGEPAFLGGSPGRDVLIWRNEMADTYERFGKIEPGQPVRIEREAIIQEGHVLRRGLVRKARGEAGS